MLVSALPAGLRWQRAKDQVEVRSKMEGTDTLAAARRRRELRYPELAGDHGRARLVVLASEVGGRWSEESRNFLRQLAKGKTRSAPRATRSRLRLAWLHRRSTILASGGARSFALSLVEPRGFLGVDGPTLASHDVEWEARYL